MLFKKNAKPEIIRSNRLLIWARFLYGEVKALAIQLCLTPWDPMNYSPPGSSVCGILQARILDWVSISFSRGIFWTQGLNPGLLHCRQFLYHLSHRGRSYFKNIYSNLLNHWWSNKWAGYFGHFIRKEVETIFVYIPIINLKCEIMILWKYHILLNNFIFKAAHRP